MGVPVSQIATIAAHVLKQRLRGRRRYPLVLMLEPLFRCNLACAGCGKIQQPAELLRRQLTPEQCFRAVDQCGAPIVSIPGGEPLLHPQIDTIVAGLVARRKYVYLCTNALKLEEALERFRPSKFLTFSVHLDGPLEDHDRAVCRQGVFRIAIRAIEAAVQSGFRVTTNTTLFAGADPQRIRHLFDRLSELGVEGMMVSPGYSYAKAPDQDHFLARRETTRLFRQILSPGEKTSRGDRRFRPLDALRGALRHPLTFSKRRWKFNQSPLFLEFLRGGIELECTPWGNPTYNLLGWQRPCYLLDEGYAATFDELLETTDWGAYGHASGNPKCAHCMVHSGHEPTAVIAMFGSFRGLLTSARLALFGSRSSEPPDVRLPSHGGCTPAAPHPVTGSDRPAVRGERIELPVRP